MKKLFLLFSLLFLLTFSWGQAGAGLDFDFELSDNGQDFGLRTSNSEFETDIEDEKRFTRNDKKEIKQITFPKNKSSKIFIQSTKSKPKNNEKVKPKIKIIEKNIFIKNKYYEVELIDETRNSYQSFVIEGADIFSVELKGKAKIEAKLNKITINITEGSITTLIFKGGILYQQNIVEDISNLCVKYNQNPDHIQHVAPEKFSEHVNRNGEKIGFYLPAKVAQSEKCIEYIRELRKLHKIENKNSVISYYDDVVITETGIGMEVDKEFTINSKKLFGLIKTSKIEKRHEIVFLTWNEYLRLNFKVEGHNRIFGTDIMTGVRFFFEKEYGSSNSGFNNWEFVQFLKDLQNLIGNRVQPIS